MELHAGSDELCDVDIQILVLALDDLVDFTLQLTSRGLKVKQLGTSGFLLDLELRHLNRVLGVQVSHLLDFLELSLVFLSCLFSDLFSLLCILDLIPVHPERLVVLIECFDMILVESIDA